MSVNLQANLLKHKAANMFKVNSKCHRTTSVCLNIYLAAEGVFLVRLKYPGFSDSIC